MDPDRPDEPHLVPPPVTPDDVVQEADEESFPASDPPARTVVTGVANAPLPQRGVRSGRPHPQPPNPPKR